MTDREKKIFKYGILVGELEAISKFNTKTDHIYDFQLKLLPKLETINKSIEDIVIDISETYELKKIETSNTFNFLFNLLHNKWFYAYQNKNEYHLTDNGNNFSLYFDDWKKEWIENFVNFLLETLKPINLYEIFYINLKQYYESDYDEFILECDDELYYFKLAVSD